MRYATLAILLAVTAGHAHADPIKISSRSDFVQTVSGKTLTRPLVKLTVTPGGEIQGKGASWEVTGNWKWQGGYFCRSLYWGGSDLGYNCQAVHLTGGKLRFTSDRGAGDYADFRLR